MKTLYSTRVWKLKSDTDHFTTDDVFCEGPDGVYRYVAAFGNDLLDTWPNTRDGKIPLWRDYWNFFADRSRSPHGPYFQQVLDAETITLKEV